jgi:hypothetical protein
MHVRLPKREGVNIRGRVQVCETVVYKSVGGLVRPNRVQNVEKLRVWTQAPIIDGNFWSFEIGPRLSYSVIFMGVRENSPFRYFSGFQVGNTSCAEKRVTT